MNKISGTEGILMSCPTWPGLFPAIKKAKKILTQVRAWTITRKKKTHPQPIEVMNDGDVHHSAEYTADIRPVHSIII
jgi:zona occludens toxin (predicted ATPase)